MKEARLHDLDNDPAHEEDGQLDDNHSNQMFHACMVGERALDPVAPSTHFHSPFTRRNDGFRAGKQTRPV